MVRATVSLVLLFLACVFAAPVPNKAKVALIRDSSIGLGFAAGQSKTFGIFEGNTGLNIQAAKREGERGPDFSLLEKVNFGAAFAIEKSISVGLIKNNIFAGKNPFTGLKFK